MATIQTADDIFGVAKWIVDPTSGSGTHTTIASALTSASAGDTIFIRPGTYTENLTLKVGVDLVAFGADAFTPNVVILGNCTLSTAGTVSISGIQFQTNSANCITVSGSVASILNLTNCFINGVNNTAISFSSSSASSIVNLLYCKGDLGTTGIGYFANTSAGTMNVHYCNFTNTGASSTASTVSAGTLNTTFSTYTTPITTSGSSTITASNIGINSGAVNATALTCGNAGTIALSTFASGTASALSVGGTLTINKCSVSSTNTNAMTGGGTIVSNETTFVNTSHLSNVTTQTGGAASGLTQGTAPSAGFIGEIITAQATNQSLASAAATTIASVALTPGVWDISSISSATAVGGTAVMIGFSTGISPTNNAQPGTLGIDFFQINATVGLLSGSVPRTRVTLSSNTTYYLVSTCTFTSSSCSVNGKINAVRVG